MIVHADVNGMGVAEQVVQIAKDFLVGADQKHTEVIRVLAGAVERQRLLDVTTVDKTIELAVRITCACRLTQTIFVELDP